MERDAVDYAPIALFAYRRVDVLAATLGALEQCPEWNESRVFIFSDGPKNEAANEDVIAVRKMLRERRRGNITIVESETNKGLSRSIQDGVHSLVSTYGKVIVIEDDLIVSPAALSWFNAGLERYRDDEGVMQISAHLPGRPKLLSRDEAFFLPLTTSWGWATWDRAWRHFDPKAEGWHELTHNRGLRRRFNFGGRYPFARMMRRQMEGRIDSWAIRWYWTVFKRGGLVLFPPASMVKNIGQDAAATHPSSFKFLVNFLRRNDSSPSLLMTVPRLPPKAEVRAEVIKAVQRGFRK